MRNMSRGVVEDKMATASIQSERHLRSTCSRGHLKVSGNHIGALLVGSVMARGPSQGSLGVLLGALGALKGCPGGHLSKNGGVR